MLVRCLYRDQYSDRTYARESTVVPQVTLVREAVTDIAQLALLHILLDGVEEFLLGDL